MASNQYSNISPSQSTSCSETPKHASFSMNDANKNLQKKNTAFYINQNLDLHSATTQGIDHDSSNQIETTKEHFHKPYFKSFKINQPKYLNPLSGFEKHLPDKSPKVLKSSLSTSTIIAEAPESQESVTSDNCTKASTNCMRNLPTVSTSIKRKPIDNVPSNKTTEYKKSNNGKWGDLISPIIVKKAMTKENSINKREQDAILFQNKDNPMPIITAPFSANFLERPTSSKDLDTFLKRNEQESLASGSIYKIAKSKEKDCSKNKHRFPQSQKQSDPNDLPEASPYLKELLKSVHSLNNKLSEEVDNEQEPSYNSAASTSQNKGAQENLFDASSSQIKTTEENLFAAGSSQNKTTEVNDSAASSQNKRSRYLNIPDIKTTEEICVLNHIMSILYQKACYYRLRNLPEDVRVARHAAAVAKINRLFQEDMDSSRPSRKFMSKLPEL